MGLIDRIRGRKSNSKPTTPPVSPSRNVRQARTTRSDGSPNTLFGAGFITNDSSGIDGGGWVGNSGDSDSGGSSSGSDAGGGSD